MGLDGLDHALRGGSGFGGWLLARWWLLRHHQCSLSVVVQQSPVGGADEFLDYLKG